MRSTEVYAIMITKEVREWMQKVERGQYSYDDAMYEFIRFSSFLTREEMKMLKSRLESLCSKKCKNKYGIRDY